MLKMSNKPLILMPEDIQRMIGKDAQRNNIAAAKMVAEVVKTTLGPKGMDKMLVSPTNDIIVTNDGVTILNEMQIEHPAAKMIVEVARTQESEIGDGTTSAVMIAGKLLENAEKLLDMKVHPTVIIKGYKLAAEKSQEILKEISFKVDSSQDNRELLKQIAMTAMTGKCAEDAKEKLAEIIIEAVKQIKGEDKSENINLDNIKIVKVRGESIKNIKDSGANVVFCQKGIDDFMQYLLTKEKIYACRRVARNDMEKLSKATGAKIISNLKEITPFEIGNSEYVKEIRHGGNILTYVYGCQSPKALTILIHGGTEHVIDEVERAIKDGLGDVFCVLKSGLIVLGGGCVEVELSRRLKIFSQSLSGREQLAVEEFANALEFIPTTLAENAGLDPIDILTELKSF